jgi:exonuclease SbcD
MILTALPRPSELAGAILKLIIEYPREYDALIDETALRKYAEGAFEFHLIRRPHVDARVRLPADQAASSLTPLELLDLYWRASQVDPAEAEALQKLAQEVISDDTAENEP